MAPTNNSASKRIATHNLLVTGFALVASAYFLFSIASTGPSQEDRSSTLIALLLSILAISAVLTTAKNPSERGVPFICIGVLTAAALPQLTSISQTDSFLLRDLFGVYLTFGIIVFGSVMSALPHVVRGSSAHKYLLYGVPTIATALLIFTFWLQRPATQSDGSASYETVDLRAR